MPTRALLPLYHPAAMADLADDAFRRTVLRTIEESVFRETGNRFERLVLLDADGAVLYVEDGHSGDVYADREELARLIGKVHLVTHNHPRGTSLTDDDLLGAIAVGAREVDAFTRMTRFRLLLSAEAVTWPDRKQLMAEIRRIDGDIQRMLVPRVLTKELTGLAAEALHRRIRWTRVAERFAGVIEYMEEQR
jgi:hypothetical protein